MTRHYSSHFCLSLFTALLPTVDKKTFVSEGMEKNSLAVSLV